MMMLMLLLLVVVVTFLVCSSLLLSWCRTCQGAKRKEEKLGRMFGGEGDVMEEHERDKVEQNALQVQWVLFEHPVCLFKRLPVAVTTVRCKLIHHPRMFAFAAEHHSGSMLHFLPSW